MEMTVEMAFMGVDIWNKRDKLLLTSKRHFYLRHQSISK